MKRQQCVTGRRCRIGICVVAVGLLAFVINVRGEAQGDTSARTGGDRHVGIDVSRAVAADPPASRAPEAANVGSPPGRSTQAIPRPSHIGYRTPSKGTAARGAHKPLRPQEDPTESATLLRARVGDDCDSATTIANLPFEGGGNTCDLEDDYDETCPLDAPGSRDVVYVYTPTEDITVDISMCGTSAYDTKVYVYENTCGIYQSGTFLTCNDDGCAEEPLASSLLGVALTAGNAYYIVVDGFGGDCGPYTIDIVEGTVREGCPSASLRGQPPNAETEPWNAQTSDAAATLLVYESFADLRAKIAGVTWWGFEADFDDVASMWADCVHDPATFDIAFYEDAGGAPGTEVCSYSMTPTREDTGTDYIEGGGGVLRLWKYSVDLQPVCDIPTGWVSIQAPAADPECLFHWLSSSVGNGTSLQDDGVELVLVSRDRSLCLSGLVVPPGEDCYKVDCALTYFGFGANPIPKDFLADGSDAFKGVIHFSGVGDDKGVTVKRLEAMDFSDPLEPTKVTPIELISMDLVSCNPIRVWTPAGVKEWNVQVKLSTLSPQMGSLTATKTHRNGGIFNMEYFVQPIFTFTRVDNSDDNRFFDTAKEGIEPMRLASLVDTPFVFTASIAFEPCGENFVPGIVEEANVARPDTACPQKCITVDTGGDDSGIGGGTKGVDCSKCPGGACCQFDGRCDDVPSTEEAHAKWICARTCADPDDDTTCGTYLGDNRQCNESDEDADGIPDLYERSYSAGESCLEANICETGTLRDKADTDDDGCPDGRERAEGTDACNPCSRPPGWPLDPADDCDSNGINDACDIISGADCDSNGIHDDCEPGTCCGISVTSGVEACLNPDTPVNPQNRAECEALDPPGTWLGPCVDCPPLDPNVVSHVSGAIIHTVGPAPGCEDLGLARAVVCNPADPKIDPWQSIEQDLANPVICENFAVHPIPAGYFGPGSDTFVDVVCLAGVPLGPEYGVFAEADTLVERTGGTTPSNGTPFDPCELPETYPVEATVDVKIVALSEVSVDPITVTYNGGQNPELWNMIVDLSDEQLMGSLTARKTSCKGGTYTATLRVRPRFTLIKVVDPGQILVFDTGLLGFPPVELVMPALGSADVAHWVHHVDPNSGVLTDPCSDFHPGITDVEGTTSQAATCDCQMNFVRDRCEIESGTSQDCNENGVPDECELSGNDCNSNDIPDECEDDCNRNGEPDDCDVDPSDPDGNGLVSMDCNSNSVPDECENDCNGNGVVDECDVPAPAGLCTVDCSEDCNENGTPDECEPDCNGNGIPDSCDMTRPVDPSPDCQPNGRPDGCDLTSEISADCNENTIPDECDIANKTSPDIDGDGVPDECVPCFVTGPPIPERLDVGQVAGVGPVNTKNRFISITTAQAGRTQIIRVRFESLPSPFNIWDDMDFYVGQPQEACENSGKDLETAPEDCPPALPTDTFWTASLVCDVSAAHAMDWRGECSDGTCSGGLNEGGPCAVDNDCVEYVHLYHEGLVPGAAYHLQVVEAACADLDLEIVYSSALVMLQSRWGDVCGPGPGGACSSVSDGIVDVANDVLGVLDKFANLNALQKARADVEPGDDGFNNGPDFKVNVANDVLFVLDAFTGAPYPFTPGDPCAPGLGSSARGQ